MRQAATRFDKYAQHGAYHWLECDPRSRNFNPPLVARYQVVVDLIPNGARVLDMGAGDGCLMSRMSRTGAEVVGIEFEPEAVRLARKMLVEGNASRIIEGSCLSLPFANDSFDIAVMADVIEHLEQPESAVKEAARVVGESGALIVTTPKWRPDRVWDERHVQEFRPGELKECLDVGFRQVELRYFWPLKWSNFYHTRLGWRAVKIFARHWSNPFLEIGQDESQYGQILAVCTQTENTSSQEFLGAFKAS